MKFINSVENGITKVILDIEASTFKSYKFDLRDTICEFEGTRDFDFTIVNEFLDSQDEITRRHIARTLINMRRCIANSYHDDQAADKCICELSKFMKDLIGNLPMIPTGNLFEDLYNFSAKYTTSGKADSHANSRQMLVAASLLSALCVMIIHDFKTHFTDVSEPLQILYTIFEEAIRDCDVDGAKEFVEENRILVSKMDDDTASWVIESIYINDCMLRKHTPLLPMDVYVVENYTQRILSSKMYFANKRIKEMKEINKAEEQQRMENNKVSVNPLTDDEIKEFNTEVENNCLLPIRNGLKDALDAILLTVNYFYRHFPSDSGYPDLSTDDLIDSISTAVSTAMLKVDEMDAAELTKIAEHTNYAYDAFKLVEEYIPDGLLFRNYQPYVKGMNFPHERYLRKVVDILSILRIPAMQYEGSDIGYVTSIHLKNRLAEYLGGKSVFDCLPGDYGYTVYRNTPVGRPYDFIYPTAMSTLRLWADANLDDNSKDKFLLFLEKHELDVLYQFKSLHEKQLHNPLTKLDYEDTCTFFYRWFLKEQTTK